MHGVSRVYLQSYLDENSWRLQNGNTDMWAVLKATLTAIRRFYKNNADGNAVLEEV
jgi:hypothetical protein